MKLQLRNNPGPETTTTCALIPVPEPRTVQHEDRNCRSEPLRDSRPILDERNTPPAQNTLQNCGQSTDQTSKAHILEETNSIGAVGAAHGSNISSLLTNIFSAAKITDDLSVSAWVPGKPPEADGTQLSNVTFRGCEQSGLTLMPDCEFEDVTFVNCKFGNTAFLRVHLTDVTISHVDFTNATLHCILLQDVTLTRAHFRNTVWRAMHFTHALIDGSSFILRPGTTRDYAVQPSTASSKTIRGFHSDSMPLVDLAQEVGQVGAWDRDIHLRFTPPKIDILTRLGEHQEIIDRIMQYCFPGSSVHIF